ncbi:MAG: PilZ domain-containing protein [Desulfobacterales bacterium]|jgi:hypothetical protein|nr:PilZ domain-containing protein [Desulfobacteraceae bacterium]MBT4365264.1 PilZ domain-containing protein [Desulfobacteraceae bacterium]MBT7084694.1 PilZ domain-containing protein [Desulfobacterales bacterium]MBT7697480.1 PilZ domain-containing protein [Desulfobacterales bacterium]
MSIIKEFISRRKNKRFKVPNDAFAILRPNSATLGQILNMSTGGLAFNYIDNGEDEYKSKLMDIFLAEDGFYMDKLPVRTVFDEKINSYSNDGSAITINRCRVQFGELSQKQIDKMKCFIPSNPRGYLQDRRAKSCNRSGDNRRSYKRHEFKETDKRKVEDRRIIERRTIRI